LAESQIRWSEIKSTWWIGEALAVAILLFLFTPPISAVIAHWFTGSGYSNAGLRIGKLRWYAYG
jgi:hypothetical protein